MKSLGKMLRSSIENSGYTIYSAANKAGINRTTLQKILSDDRSASQELLSQLLPILKLSPSEVKNILDLFEISQDGESIYRQRRYIKRMLESLSSFDLLPHNAKESDQRLLMYQAAVSGYTQQLIHGAYNVEHLLGNLFTKECLKKDSEICVNVPGNLVILNQFLMNNISDCRQVTNLTIHHITSLVKNPESSINPLINLDILSKILPYTFCDKINYKIYYYYNNEINYDTINYAFPYYIIFSNLIVLLNADGSTALTIPDPTVLQHFHNLFVESLKHTCDLISDCPTPFGIFDYLSEADKKQPKQHVIGFQPDFTAFLTESMLQNYIQPDMKNRTKLIRSILQRAKQLTHSEDHVSIFSQTGLADFIQTGIMSNFIADYMTPMEKDDRIVILKSLYDACWSDKITLRIANPVVFQISGHVICNLRSDWGLDFNGYSENDNTFKYLHITEQTITEAFADFFKYVMESGLVYTKEETLMEIRNGIGFLNRSEEG